MIVTHLYSSKVKVCNEIFKNVFSKIQRKELDIENQITLKFFELEMNQSNAWQKNK